MLLISLILSILSLGASGVAIYMSCKSLNNDKVTKELVDQMADALKKRYIF